MYFQVLFRMAEEHMEVQEERVQQNWSSRPNKIG